jgi:DUF1365 family protein
MNSILYDGSIEHIRYQPVHHKLRYRLYVYGFDLDELPALDRHMPLFGYNRFRPAAIYDRDYLHDGPGGIREKLFSLINDSELAGRTASVRLITSARYFNYVFNPVSFYYCLDKNRRVIAVAAEVNNTFGERHVYFPKTRSRHADDQGPYYARKAFHVSPFNDMEGEYEFFFSPPGADLDIRVRLLKEGVETFSARLQGKALPLTAGNQLKMILGHPLLPHLTKPRIFFEAARLFFQKKLAYHEKPEPISPMTIKRRRPSHDKKTDIR